MREVPHAREETVKDIMKKYGKENTPQKGEVLDWSQIQVAWKSWNRKAKVVWKKKTKIELRLSDVNPFLS